MILKLEINYETKSNYKEIFTHDLFLNILPDNDYSCYY